MLKNNTPEGGLYIIWLSDTHYYGGRTTNFKRRWRNHLRELRGGIHGNSRMQRVFNIHGRFEPKVLAILDRGAHQDVEQAWLDDNFRKPGCVNVNPLACGGCVSHSAETRAKMSKTRKSRPDLVEKARQQIIRSNKSRAGIPLQQTHRDALSQAMFGRKQLPEHVEKRAAAIRGRKNTAETKAKMSVAAKRRCVEHPQSHGESTKALISSQQKGRVWVNDGKTNRRLFPEEAESLLASGWLPGRKPRPQGALHGNTGLCRA